MGPRMMDYLLEKYSNGVYKAKQTWTQQPTLEKTRPHCSLEVCSGNMEMPKRNYPWIG